MRTGLAVDYRECEPMGPITPTAPGLRRVRRHGCRGLVGGRRSDGRRPSAGVREGRRCAHAHGRAGGIAPRDLGDPRVPRAPGGAVGDLWEVRQQLGYGRLVPRHDLHLAAGAGALPALGGAPWVEPRAVGARVRRRRGGRRAGDEPRLRRPGGDRHARRRVRRRLYGDQAGRATWTHYTGCRKRAWRRAAARLVRGRRLG